MFEDEKESAAIDRLLKDTAERWRSVSMELRCVQSMLEELVAYWRRWHSELPPLEHWLDQALSALHQEGDEESKLELFQVYST